MTEKLKNAKRAKCFLKMAACDHKLLSCVKAIKCIINISLTINVIISVILMCKAAKE